MRRLLFALLCLAAKASAQNAVWVDLSGDWLTTSEDRPEFASVDFDDSTWTKIRLPGGEHRFQVERWLGKRVELPAGAAQMPLSLTLGTLQGVYEVFVNGVSAGTTGSLQDRSDAEIHRPRTFAIPPEAVTGHRFLQISIRIAAHLYMPPAWRLPDTGPFLLTSRDAAPVAAGHQAMDKLRLLNMQGNVLVPVLFVIPLLSLLAWLKERNRRDLFWFGLAALTYASYAVYSYILLADDARPFNSLGVTEEKFLLSYSLYSALYGHFVLTSLSIRNRWVYGAVWASWVGIAVTVRFENYYYLGMPIGHLTIAAVALAVIARDWRRSRRPGFVASHTPRFILSLPMLFSALFWAGQWKTGESLIPDTFPLGSFHISIEDAFWLFVSSAILAILLRGVFDESAERRRLAEEFRAAQIVQRLLLPASGAPGLFHTECIYEPAREVGGDFYQIQNRPNGSLLVLVGDVSGKGLEAAMVASVAVGAFRSLESSSPAVLLEGLNRALVGNGRTGFVTCCCARFDPDGTVTVANAGNPPPYRNGDEMELDAGLPLGLVAEAEWPETSMPFGTGAQVTFISDGVPEAANAVNELFGYERSREMSPRSASAIAEAAKAWGQNDDITVVTVRRIASGDTRRTA